MFIGDAILSILYKLMHRFNTITIRILPHCFNWQADSNIYMAMQKIKNSQNDFEKEEVAGMSTLSDFKDLLRIYSNGIKTVLFWVNIHI